MTFPILFSFPWDFVTLRAFKSIHETYRTLSVYCTLYLQTIPCSKCSYSLHSGGRLRAISTFWPAWGLRLLIGQLLLLPGGSVSPGRHWGSLLPCAFPVSPCGRCAAFTATKEWRGWVTLQPFPAPWRRFSHHGFDREISLWRKSHRIWLEKRLLIFNNA